MPVFETPGSVSLQIKLPSGRVVVTTADEPQTTVEVVAVGRRGQDAMDEIEVTMEERLGRHVVKVEQKDRFRWGPIQITWGGDFECRITCPPGTDLELSGGSTDVRVDGELGEVSVRTASGDIRLESARAELQVKTASGDIVRRRRSRVRDVIVDGVRAISGSSASTRRSPRERSPATSRSESYRGGARRLDHVGRCRHQVGVEAGTSACRRSRATFESGSRAEHAYWVDAASVSGRLESELGLDDRACRRDEGGTVVPLHVKTVSGDVVGRPRGRGLLAS